MGNKNSSIVSPAPPSDNLETSHAKSLSTSPQQKLVIASSLPSGNIINNCDSKNEFSTGNNEYLYLPNMVPGVIGLHDRVMYFSVTPGPENRGNENKICFIEPATEHFQDDTSSTQGSFRSKMKRTYTPIYLEASSSHYDLENNYQRQGSHVPS